MNALEIQGLKKAFVSKVSGHTLEALKGVDFSVKEGDFFALLGPNGAGKSTIINILTSLLPKDSGSIQVFGKDIDTENKAVKQLIGVVPQEFNFSIFEKVLGIVITQAGYYGIGRKIAMERAEKYLRLLDLWEKKDTQAMRLSGGMKRRLMIARALVHEPKLLILDEPTAGVDIELRRSMWNFITELNKQGTTVILTTHYLEEAENLCRNIAIIDKGVIVENTSMKSLLNTLDGQSLVFDMAKNVKDVLKLKPFAATMIDEKTIEVSVTKSQNITSLFQLFVKHKLEVVSMRNKTNRLEELFVNVINSQGPKSKTATKVVENRIKSKKK